jgi:hypothetical protein
LEHPVGDGFRRCPDSRVATRRRKAKERDALVGRRCRRLGRLGARAEKSDGGGQSDHSSGEAAEHQRSLEQRRGHSLDFGHWL